MTGLKGYASKILYVDIADGSTRKDDLPIEFPRKFLGGIGFASYLLYKEVKHLAPLSPENRLYVAPGLFVGTGIPTGSKTAFVSRSPLTGGYGRAIVGASLGVQLKRAGYEVLIIQGASEKPVVLVILDDKVSVEDGSEFWDLDIRECATRLRAKYGDVQTAIIGPAGERLSCIAGIDCQERQAARTGLGAVMGSKKLKAIVAKGTRRVEYADSEAVRDLGVKWTKILREHHSSLLNMKYGTSEFYDWMNREKGTFPSRNWQQGYFQKSFDNLKGEERSKLDPYYWSPIYMIRNKPCPNCTKPCGRIFRVKEGKYAETELDGVEYETVYSLGGNLEIDDIEALAKIHLTCDLYGLDAISAGLTLSWAMEATERGLLENRDLDGIELKFGDVESSLKVLKAIAYREGKAGELLADGTKAASEKLGKGSEKFAMHVKGLEMPAYDIRGIKGMALAEAVNIRGGDHLTAVVYGTELVGKWWKFIDVDRFSAENKGYEVKVHEDMMTLYDILGVCKFSRHMFFVEGYPELVQPVTGMSLTVSDLLTIGERVLNIQRAFWNREGFTRKDDMLPYRVLNEPIPAGKSKGNYVSHDELQHMLDSYYAARGWSSDGVPTKAKLFSLDLPDLAEEIGAYH